MRWQRTVTEQGKEPPYPTSPAAGHWQPRSRLKSEHTLCPLRGRAWQEARRTCPRGEFSFLSLLSAALRPAFLGISVSFTRQHLHPRKRIPGPGFGGTVLVGFPSLPPSCYERAEPAGSFPGVLLRPPTLPPRLSNCAVMGKREEARAVPGSAFSDSVINALPSGKTQTPPAPCVDLTKSGNSWEAQGIADSIP